MHVEDLEEPNQEPSAECDRCGWPMRHHIQSCEYYFLQNAYLELEEKCNELSDTILAEQKKVKIYAVATLVLLASTFILFNLWLWKAC